MRYALYGSLVCVFVVAMSAPVWVGKSQSAEELFGRNGSVEFVAHDYGFSGPDRIPAGLTTVRIVNQGRDLHHVQFVKLLRGKTAADFRAAIATDPGRLPGWAELAGGPNAH